MLVSQPAHPPQVGGPPPAPTPVPVLWTISQPETIASLDGSWCLDVGSQCPTNGPQLAVSPCNGSPGQNLEYDATTRNIVQRNSSGTICACLDNGGNYVNEGAVTANACTGSAGQVWNWLSTGLIESSNTNFALNVTGGNYVPWQSVRMYASSSTSGDEKFESAFGVQATCVQPPYAAGALKAACGGYVEICDGWVRTGCGAASNGSPLTCVNGSCAQLPMIEGGPSGGGWCLDAGPEALVNGNPVVVNQCSGAASQQFQYFPATGQICLADGFGDKTYCLDVADGNFMAGQPLKIWENGAVANEAFTWSSGNEIEAKDTANGTLCLDPVYESDSDWAPGAPVALEPCNNIPLVAYSTVDQPVPPNFTLLEGLPVPDTFCQPANTSGTLSAGEPCGGGDTTGTWEPNNCGGGDFGTCAASGPVLLFTYPLPVTLTNGEVITQSPVAPLQCLNQRCGFGSFTSYAGGFCGSDFDGNSPPTRVGTCAPGLVCVSPVNNAWGAGNGVCYAP